MTSFGKHLFSKMIESNPTLGEGPHGYYWSASLRFCESLIKDKEEAQKMVCTVFSDLSDTPSGLRISDPNFESRLFIMLRTQVFNYLKTAAKRELVSVH
ncbi:hypothetical protein [Larkinella rosea]|uniref:Uncharacterized protein n=1 Tax=Larkinella rosea TaxID=2025312 RepID=A0A3P1BUU3_9BACT|nr:hypothetical protein [Larkinella rosea]RRB04656.1 hypothetical protein EHT25_14385 [Larkinella rosea]